MADVYVPLPTIRGNELYAMNKFINFLLETPWWGFLLLSLPSAFSLYRLDLPANLLEDMDKADPRDAWAEKQDQLLGLG